MSAFSTDELLRLYNELRDASDVLNVTLNRSSPPDKVGVYIINGEQQYRFLCSYPSVKTALQEAYEDIERRIGKVKTWLLHSIEPGLSKEEEQELDATERYYLGTRDGVPVYRLGYPIG